MEIIFATNNRHKISEIEKAVGHDFFLRGLKDAGIHEDIPEEEDTLEGNALSKARYVFNKTGCNVFADDTGLEVNALDNEPGVLSARYAGPGKDSDDNMNKLLAGLSGITDRRARFRTIIALIIDGKEYLFEGKVEGSIGHTKKGTDGFGYDPIFIPEGLDKTFAEMGITEKNRISHRARAVRKLIVFLEKYRQQ